MTTDIHTMSPPELRGYARGLRATAALLGSTFHTQAFVGSVTTLAQATVAAWEREADLVEAFAGRLEGAAPIEDQPRPVTAERVAAWAARFESFARHTTPHPARASLICPAEGAPCQPGCTMAEGGSCARASATKEERAQAGLADAVAESLATQPPAPRPMRSDSPWTEERLALLERLTPTVMHIETMLELINAMPGLPVASAEAVRLKALKMGFHRMGPPIPDEFTGAATSRSRAPRAVKPEAPAPSPPTPTTTETAEDLLAPRREKARALFMTGMKPRDIAAQLGIPEGSINAWASTKGWRKDLAALQAAAPPPAPTTAEASPSAKAVARRKANQAAQEAADMTDPALNAAEIHEAREKLAKGEGAAALHEWFGGGLGWWQAWCETQRERAA